MLRPGNVAGVCLHGAMPADPNDALEARRTSNPRGRQDEYICDGGDLNHDVYVKQDWTVVGLDQEDTIAHYDTQDGQTEVAASNCVCIYAPRFAAVRQVSTPIIYEGHERMAGVEKPAKLNIHEEKRGPRRPPLQPEQLIAQVGLDQAQRFRERTQGPARRSSHSAGTGRRRLPAARKSAVHPARRVRCQRKARLAEHVAAARPGPTTRPSQVLIDGQPAVEVRGTSTPQVTYTYETGGKPCLRLCKIADKSEAKPGEIITFTLRFDNVGEQKIGNVTIIDHLMPRLEYVAGSAQSSAARPASPRKSSFPASRSSSAGRSTSRWKSTRAASCDSRRKCARYYVAGTAANTAS